MAARSGDAHLALFLIGGANQSEVYEKLRLIAMMCCESDILYSLQTGFGR